ncbi:uncharacterized protein LOC142333763 isoform X2 [Lycorma delicatula]|uniref:uncharacterized protein LOC142333763 isoform X2 n=1 Tax=Lycorma delicatula TaxID=130591 RepID=UPI003F50E396
MPIFKKKKCKKFKSSRFYISGSRNTSSSSDVPNGDDAKTSKNNLVNYDELLKDDDKTEEEKKTVINVENKRKKTFMRNLLLLNKQKQYCESKKLNKNLKIVPEVTENSAINTIDEEPVELFKSNDQIELNNFCESIFDKRMTINSINCGNDDDDDDTDVLNVRKCKKIRKFNKFWSSSSLNLESLNVCSHCNNISLSDKFSVFEDSLTEDNKNKLLEIKLSLIEYEKTYNQELRVLMLLAKQAISWKYYLPLFSRRCISRNIQKIKLHSDYLEQCLECKNNGNVFELIEVLDSHIEEKYLIMLSIYCENMGELRHMFHHQMKKNSEFLKLLFSSYFQIERTLLPIHHLTNIRTLIIDIIGIIPNDMNNVFYCKIKSFDRKLSRMLAKCYEITTSIYGLKYLRKIENLFPFDLNFSSSSFDEHISINNRNDDFIITHEMMKWSTGINSDDDDYDNVDNKDDIIRNKKLNGNEEINLIELNEFIRKIKFNYNDKISNKLSFSIDSNLHVLENIDDCDDGNGISNKTSPVQLKLDEDLDNNLSNGSFSQKFNCKNNFKEDAIEKTRTLFNVLPFRTFNRKHINNSEDLDEHEYVEMVELSAISYQARLRLKNEYLKSSTLPLCSMLNKTFEDEPLYQIYAESSLQSDGDNLSESEGKVKSHTAVFYIETENDKDNCSDTTSDNTGDDDKSINMIDNNCNSDDNISENSTSFISRPPPSIQRTLWKETEKVINQGILDNMSKYDLALQESKYEILTSEVSYLKSLTILVAVFIESPELNEILTDEDKSNLFKHVLKVKEASEKFLDDLAGHWNQDVLMRQVYSVIKNHINTTFRVYVDYCSNQINLHRTLQRLLIQDNNFVQLTRELENSPECFGYSLDSFLTLPMQRVTRLPLLLEAVQRRLPPDSEEIEDCKCALQLLYTLVKDCNESVRKIEQSNESAQFKKKMSLDTTTKVGLSSRFFKFDKLNSGRRWSLFNIREVKSNG